MIQKTSINIKPCNIGSSEAHNRRSAEYLAHIHKERFYIRTDLMARNETWNERIRKDIENTVRSEVEKQTRILIREKQNAETERDRVLAQNHSLTIEKEKAARQLQEQKADEQRRISLAVNQTAAEKDKTIRMLKGALKTSKDILNAFADFLYKANEVFKAAIDAIISFCTEQHKSVFAPSEAADIKSVMQEYGETTEQRKAVGAWLCDYAEHLQPFDEIKHRHTLNEVGDVAEGKYDWKIDREIGELKR